MAALDLNGAYWRKSSWSGAEGNCVEVGTAPGAVGVRDTKAHGTGPELAFTPAAWVAFLADVKAGRYDLA